MRMYITARSIILHEATSHASEALLSMTARHSVLFSSDSILRELAAKAATFDFPVLDNANWRYVTGRLRGFKSAESWGMVFELFIFHVPLSAFESRFMVMDR